MADQRGLRELHEQVTSEITESRSKEMEAMRAVTAEAAAAAEPRQAEQQQQIASMLGVKVSDLERQENERNSEAEKRFREAESIQNAQSEGFVAPLELAASPLDVESNFLPNAATTLRPSWIASFSSDSSEQQLVQASEAVAQDVVTGGATKDYYNWASGGGWGCGSGVGEIQSWVEFGFWYYPTVSKFYSIQPLFRYRGYYIVQADDRWYDCKHARTVVSAWVNVYQYNWKGWNAINVLDVGNDNINVNNRFDTDRYTYNSALLGAGDWAWIRCTIGLYARAQGGGSYVKNDFATGNANYLSVPWCYVF